MTQDAFRRPLEDLRISVTDRCNFRCTYCMPHAVYEWLEREEILTFEEITRVAQVFVQLGVKKIRLTGGEPLLRKDLSVLVRQLRAMPGLDDLCLTTNASLLADQAVALKQAGLTRINISLDTLDHEHFRQMAQRDHLDETLAGIEAARQAGFAPIKINTVVERGKNEDDLVDLVRFARERGLINRFIEYMDVGHANRWTLDRLVPSNEILARIQQHFPLRPPSRRSASDPAQVYEFEDGPGEVGVIASVTEPFCGHCTRARMTADGKLVTCLFASEGTDLKETLRGSGRGGGGDRGSGANRRNSDKVLHEKIAAIWAARTNRYSEQRLAALRSDTGYDPDDHDRFEMISLGG
jgi:cyclic pyranopterin phosphate synthase